MKTCDFNFCEITLSNKRQRHSAALHRPNSDLVQRIFGNGKSSIRLTFLLQLDFAERILQIHAAYIEGTIQSTQESIDVWNEYSSLTVLSLNYRASEQKRFLPIRLLDGLS